VLIAILVLAALLRLVALPRRGEWDDDQGIEMVAMLRWVRDGQVPLLGPLSSAPTVHHGAWFYWILAPGAFATDAHPIAAMITLAVIGIAGVAAVWWLGHTVGGPLAGHLAALLMAVSPSAINASTFVWNANIVAPGAALAAAAAWQAWRTRRARWWLLSAGGGLLMLNGHLLAVLAVPSFTALVVADVLRRPRSEWPRMLAPILGSGAIIALGYLPNLVYDLHNGFAQSHAIAEFLATADESDGPSVPARLLTIYQRVLAWPVSGFAKSAPLSGWPAAFIATAALLFVAVGGRGITRLFGCWAAATTVWAVLALSVVSPSLATSFIGLPTDQYHTWLDPILFATIGIAGAHLWSMRTALMPRTAAVALVGSCVALSLLSLPPWSSPDGGWPRAAATATRIRAITGDHTTAVIGVAKTGAALEFPLRRQHSPIAEPAVAEYLVITCDPLFFRVAVLPCGGQAEAAMAREVGFPTARVVARFADGPRRVISIFANH
jgi:4-amino-4-deoxy-L-arabinose transferase-like glycosyltransferase